MRSILNILADIAFGIFAPERYEIENHKGYNVVKLQDHYRSVIILKYRDGVANVRVGKFFDGASGHFQELPAPEEMSDEDYEILMGKVGLLDSQQPNQVTLDFWKK